ncbi:hypothetical protein ABE867_11010 [Enterococcus gallinarum]|uniref:hypothetical protein n=1 Tax=Enterococcus gallinarum TaxID=1353 RepID=UPI003D6C4119
MSYKCPICLEGIFEIVETRNGPPGFRTTDYDLVHQTCNCDVYSNERNLMAIKSFKEEGYNVNCDFCNNQIAVVEYDYYDMESFKREEKKICSSCFKKAAKKDPS